MKKFGRSALVVLGGLALLSIVFGNGIDAFLPLVLIIGGVFLVLYGFKGYRRPADPQRAPLLSPEKEKHYLASGMTPKEIDFFRDTMNAAKHQIDHLQDNVNKNAKLRAIDLRHDTLKASKALFKELVKEPQKLHYANHFLYTHLPNMVELTDKFIEINGHEIKNQETYRKIEESSQIIDQMASLISQDYQQFVADDLDELDVEMSIAKQSLKRGHN